MHELLNFPIRVSAFVGKEIYEILRQPKLVLTMILGPFLVLLLVGIGYRNEPREFRTLFVIPQGSNIGADVEKYATSFSPQFIYMGTIDNQAEATQRLREGDVELVIVVPPDAEASIENNQRANFIIYHNEIDPVQAGYVEFVGNYYVGELNRLVLETATSEGQSQASTVQGDIAQAQASAAAMRDALQRNDSATAKQHQAALTAQLDGLDQRVGVSAGLLASLAESATAGGADLDIEGISTSLTSARQDTDSLSTIPDDCSTCAAQVPVAQKVEGELTTLNSLLGKFDSISSSVLVSPFGSETRSIAPIQPRITDFFAPAVLALLLQHIAVTFAALSIVRERQLGTVELFRISPLSAIETLIGKYSSYLIFGGVLAAILSGLLIYFMEVPMLGNWFSYAAVVMVLLFTSLGIGFVISLIADTDSQAIQYSMLVLLTSVFFSGLFVSQYLIWEPMRVISWMLPVTYGMTMFQDIMLRGQALNGLLLAGLLGIGLWLFLLAWVQMRRLMARA